MATKKISFIFTVECDETEIDNLVNCRKREGGLDTYSKEEYLHTVSGYFQLEMLKIVSTYSSIVGITANGKVQEIDI